MKIWKDKLSEDYNLVWNSYIKNENIKNTVNSRLTDRRPYYDVIKKYISHFENPTVLELGCGTGIDINLVYNENRNILPCASDLLIKSIEIGCNVRQLFNNKIEFFVSNTLKIPMKNNKVDIVFSQGLIEHFKIPIEIVKEQARVLKKGGFLIINVPQKYTGYTVMKKGKMRRGTWKLGWEGEFSYNALKKIGNHLDLKEVSISGCQYWRSWREPVFILKDLVDKLFRKVPLDRYRIFSTLQEKYNAFWSKLEHKWGHYFLQNIIIVFEK